MLKKLSNLLVKALDTLRVGTRAEALTNKALLEQMAAHFKRQIEEHSVRRRMLYPMMFYIFIHPDDWAHRKDDLQFIILEIIDEFYAILHSYLGRHPDFTPPAREWFFQFSELTDGSVLTDRGERIALQEQGKAYIMSRLLAPNLYAQGGTSGVVEQTNVKFSLCVKNSDIDSTVNINPEAIAKIDRLGDGVITRKFDMTLGGRIENNEVKATVVQRTETSANVPCPELAWQMGGKNYHYTLKNRLLFVSGPQETMTGDHILKIDNEHVQTKHLRIQYDEGRQQYIICAFAPTILNERQMQLSTEASPVYYVLSKRSSIILGQAFKIEYQLK